MPCLTGKRQMGLSIFGNVVDKFPPMPLYWSDLQKIIKTGTDRGLNLTISVGKEEFDSLELLREEQGDRIKHLQLKFHGDTPYSSIDVSMGAGGVRIATSKNEKLLMTALELKEAFADRLPIQARIMRPVLWTAVTAIALYIAAHENWHLSQNIAQGMVVLVPLWMTLLSCHYVLTNSVVHLKKKHEVESIWSRYGEKVLLLVAGGGITMAFQLLAHQLTK